MLIFIYAWFYDKWQHLMSSSELLPEPKPEIPLVRTVSELDIQSDLPASELHDRYSKHVIEVKPKRKYTRHVKSLVVKSKKKKNARKSNSA